MYILVVDDAPFETLLEYCCRGNRYIPFSRYLLSLSLSHSLFSVPITLSYPPTRVTRRMVSADSKGRPRRMLSLDQCAHLNWMSIRDLISEMSNIVRVSLAVRNFSRPELTFFSVYFEWVILMSKEVESKKFSRLILFSRSMNKWENLIHLMSDVFNFSRILIQELSLIIIN